MTTTDPERFRYLDLRVDVGTGELRCRYQLGEHHFEERFAFGAGLDWGPAALAAARLVFLLAGVSYYKASPAPVLDLGDHPLSPLEAGFLRDYYVEGLGEFAYNNREVLARRPVGANLAGLRIEAPSAPTHPAPVAASGDPLVPFGGGLDSLVSVDLIRRRSPGLSLFVMSRAGSRFAAIEDAAAVTGLPVARAERTLDPTILRSAELGFLNGHVPITGLLSAVAVLRAVLDGRSAVVMSNEWSASSGNLVVEGVEVNHQYSKSLRFETAFRSVLAESLPGFEYFSLLRPRSELWIARHFAGLEGFHRVFHSCNRAFHLDASARMDRWCGRCDKCCFIDLVLAPFLAPSELAAIFDGHEPLDDPSLQPVFETLLDLSGDTKPFECVGDVTECRAALVLAADRADRAGHPLIGALLARLGPAADEARTAVPDLFEPLGPHHIPDAYLDAALVG